MKKSEKNYSVKGLKKAFNLILLMLLYATAFSTLKSQDNSDYTGTLVSLYEHDNKTFVLVDVFEYSKMRNVSSLELKSSTLDEIPEWIFKLKELEELIINCTELKVIPSDISKLENLKVLDLSNTSVNELPEQLSKLLHLQELYLPNTFNKYKLDEFKKSTKAKVILD